MKIRFIYNEKLNKRCWLRYNRFVKANRNIWGRHPQATGPIKINKADFEIDVTDIINAYRRIFGIKVKIKGHVVSTPYSMIDDDGVFSKNESVIYYSVHNGPIWTVLAHEIFHIYFEKYTQRDIPNYEESKEYFTVIMNDIFGRNISQGYPNHQRIRELILEKWKRTKSIEACISTLKQLSG